MNWDDPIGCELQLQTCLGEEIIGEVAAYDKPSNILVLTQPGSFPDHHNLIILRTNYIKTIKYAKRLRSTHNGQDIDFQKLIERNAKAVAAMQTEFAKIGIGVSAEAQQIYDALQKTLPCKWDGKKIVVLQEVVIDEPYNSGACGGLSSHPDANLLQRVKQVLDEERKRLGLGV